MITAAERRAKIEKLRKEREAKEAERLEREKKRKEEAASSTSSNQLIQQILSHNTEASEALISSAATPGAGQVQVSQQKETRLPLRVSPFVVELEIPGMRPPETYDKEIQCEIVDPK